MECGWCSRERVYLVFSSQKGKQEVKLDPFFLSFCVSLALAEISIEGGGTQGQLVQRWMPHPWKYSCPGWTWLSNLI